MSDYIQLIHGDCLQKMEMLEDNSIDFIFCDLPYGTTRNKWDSIINLQEMWKEFHRIMKNNACIALWGQEPFTTSLIISNINEFRYKWIVCKTNATGFLNARRMPLKSYEEVLIFYKSLPTYNPQKTKGKRKVSTAEHRKNTKRSTNYNDVTPNSYDSDERFPRDVLTFSWDKQKSALHPTQKPVSACEYFIQTYTNEGNTVLDITMGSGSTGVACINTHRQFIGIEKDEEIYHMCKQRIATTLTNKGFQCLQKERL